MGHPRRVVLLLFAGSLLLQLAWIITLPPFRGLDEFDHAYRAAAVAHGQWVANYHAPIFDGRGSLVLAPRRLVEAARPECYTYTYTKYANCNPVANAGHGYVTVASAAATYNPVFYWIVGTPAKLFQGAGSLQAMRVAGALLCSALIAGIGWILTKWATSAWPFVGLAVGLTPTVVYTSILPAPNGVEMLGGLGLWAALLGLTRVGEDPARERTLIRAATLMAVPLVFVRSLGPLWLGLIVATMLGYFGGRRTLAMVRRNPRTWASNTAIVAAATVGGVTWTMAAGTNSLSGGDAGHFKHPFIDGTQQIILWPFQSFAAFPARNEFSPLFVYMLGFVVLLVFLAASTRVADRRTKVLILVVALLAIMVPWLITLKTYSVLGAVWQGRYTLPYALGLPLIASIPLELAQRRLRFTLLAVSLGFFAYVTAQLTSILHVLVHERQGSPLANTSEWWVPPLWLVGVLIVAGMSAEWLPCLRQSLTRTSQVEETPFARVLKEPRAADVST